MIEIGYLILSALGLGFLAIVVMLSDRPWKNRNQKRGYICPFNNNIDCPYIDTAGMSKTKECPDCEHYIKRKIRIDLK
jgi:hypothetical protein